LSEAFKGSLKVVKLLDQPKEAEKLRRKAASCSTFQEEFYRRGIL